MLVDAFCLLLMTDELFNKLHINHSALVESCCRQKFHIYKLLEEPEL